jgi:general secretion pathway protein A
MVRDRIVAPLIMQALNLEETRQMIRTRLERWDVQDPFEPKAIEKVYELSGGVPRRVLLLCQQACDRSQEGQKVTAQHVEDAYQVLQITEPEELAAMAV